MSMKTKEMLSFSPLNEIGTINLQPFERQFEASSYFGRFGVSKSVRMVNVRLKDERRCILGYSEKSYEMLWTFSSVVSTSITNVPRKE